MHFSEPKKRRKYIVLAYFIYGFFNLTTAYGQLDKLEIDSIKNLLPSQQDTQLVHSYIKLSSSLHVPEDEAERYALKCYTLSDSINYDFGKIKASYLLGSIYHFFREYEKAVIHYKRGLKVALEAGMPQEIIKGYNYIPNTWFYLKQMDSALAYNQLYREQAIRMGDSAALAYSYGKDGDYYFRQSLTDLSLKSYMKASRLAEQLNDSAEIIRAYSDIALVLERRGENEDAIDYYRKSIDIGRRIQNPFTQIPAMLNVSILYREEDMPDSVEYILKQAEQILTDNDPAGKVDLYFYEMLQIAVAVNQARLTVYRSNYMEGLKMCDQIMAKFGEAVNEARQASIAQIRANAYLGLKRYNEAYQQGLIAREINNKSGATDDLLEVLSLLVSIESARENFAQAMQFQQQYISLKDSLTQTENKKAYKSLYLEFETENKEREIAALKQEKLENENRRNLLLAVLSSISLLALGFILFLRYRARKNKEMLEQERELDRMKSRFFTQLSHELRTPLTLILGPLLQLLEKQNETETVSKLQLIQRNANRLLQLVNQVMDLSKIQAGKQELHAAPLQLKPLLSYIFTSFDSKAEAKQLDYQLIMPEEPVELYLDGDKFQQIMGNLISNGCKFVPPEGKLWIHLENKEGEVVIHVEDSGPGVSSLQQAHIFDPYFQADSARQTEDAGTGIGLALSKELVELHGGTITIDSELGKGTRFTLRFLKGRAHLRDEQINYVKSGQHVDGNTLFQQKETDLAPTLVPAAVPTDSSLPLILVAEDVKDMREYLYNILYKDFRLLFAPNGKLALELAQTEMPDLVISDIMMPEMDGLSFSHALKSDSRTDHIPIVFLTAKMTNEDRMEGWKHDAHAFLTKPFNANELLLVINSVLRSQERMQVRFQGEVILKPSEVAVSSQESIFLNKLTDFLESHLDNTELSVEMLAAGMALSRSQLHRKLKSLTGKTPTDFIKNFRLQRARQLLEKGYGNMAEIADAVGISTPSYFSRIFIEAFGVSPSQWTSEAMK